MIVIILIKITIIETMKSVIVLLNIKLKKLMIKNESIDISRSKNFYTENSINISKNNISTKNNRNNTFDIDNFFRSKIEFFNNPYILIFKIIKRIVF